MRLELREHQGYDDGSVVHHVTEIVGHLKEGEKFQHTHHYPTACGIDGWKQYLCYVNKPTTCMVCLAAHRPGHIKCRRFACNRVLPIEAMWIHRQSGEPYCSTCASRINGHTYKLVVPQS